MSLTGRKNGTGHRCFAGDWSGIALELARAGAKVALNYQSNDAKAQAVADEISALPGTALLVKANVGVAAEARAMVKQVADEFGRLDILVNNAGITRDTSLKKMTDEQWQDVIQTNLNGYFYCTSAAIPVMTEQKSGRIINISSMNGQIAAFGQANYSASKGGIIAFTKTAALELAKSGITVNTVSPGFTETDMFAERSGEDPGPDQTADSNGKIRQARGDRPCGDLLGRRMQTTSRASRSTSMVGHSCSRFVHPEIGGIVAAKHFPPLFRSQILYRGVKNVYEQ